MQRVLSGNEKGIVEHRRRCRIEPFERVITLIPSLNTSLPEILLLC